MKWALEQSRQTITIRSATPDDAAGIARVHVDSWKSTYPGILPEAAIKSISFEKQQAVWKRALETAVGRLILVAEAGGDVVAYATAGPARDRGVPRFTGEVFTLYVLQGWQGRGIGRALFSRARDALVKAGHEQMIVWVVAENPAVWFYESQGGLTIAERDDIVAGTPVRLRAYGWWLCPSGARNAL